MPPVVCKTNSNLFVASDGKISKSLTSFINLPVLQMHPVHRCGIHVELIPLLHSIQDLLSQRTIDATVARYGIPRFILEYVLAGVHSFIFFIAIGSRKIPGTLAAE